MNADVVTEIAALAQQAQAHDLTANVTLADNHTYTFRNDPTEYGRQLGGLLSPPPVDYVEVETLTGFVDAIKATAADPANFFVHINDHLTVSLKERGLNLWNKRPTHILARHQPIDAFRFDYYYTEPARFIIALQTAFLVTEELLYLIKVASNLKAGNTVQTQDDGFSQTVTIKTGETTSADAKIPPRIKLIPLRTFPEAAPVQSEFLIRLQQSPQGVPTIALFDVDGKKWQGQLMQSIKNWLSGQIDSAFPIIA